MAARPTGTSAGPPSWIGPSTAASRRWSPSRTPRREAGSPRRSSCSSRTTAAPGSSGRTAGGAGPRRSTVTPGPATSTRSSSRWPLPPRSPPPRLTAPGPARGRWTRGREPRNAVAGAHDVGAQAVTSTSRSGRPVEIELKYRVLDPIAGDRYLAADDLAGFHPTSPVRATQVEDRYIDTPDGALARAGFAARIRQTAKQTTVAVKSAVRRVDGGNVHRREELEGPADRTAPPRDWPASDARSLILEQCGDAPLVEVVTIRQLRRKRILQRDGTSVELSLDEVDAVSRSRVVGRFVELEVELMNGDEAGLADIDRELAVDAGLAPADTSKLQSALRAVAAAEPKRGRRPSALTPIDDDPSVLPDRAAPPIATIVEAVLLELDASTTEEEEAAEAANEAEAPDAEDTSVEAIEVIEPTASIHSADGGGARPD